MRWILTGIGASVVTLFVTMGIIRASREIAPPGPPPPTLTAWVRFFGCPATTASRAGPQHLVLIFSDGKATVVRLDTMSAQKRAELAQHIGDVGGVVIVSQCAVVL
jgi:hypothetical protein